MKIIETYATRHTKVISIENNTDNVNPFITAYKKNSPSFLCKFGSFDFLILKY